MQTPEWLKPGLYGAACGAVALAVIGFSWGGWITGGTARTMAADQSKAEVVTALSLICVDQSKRDPQLGFALSQFTEAERLLTLSTATAPRRGALN